MVGVSCVEHLDREPAGGALWSAVLEVYDNLAVVDRYPKPVYRE